MHTIAHHLLAGCTGLFFAISGYHKTFNAMRRESLRAVLTRLRIPFVAFNVRFVALAELIGGSLLMFTHGIVALLSAGALLAICIVACLTEGVHKIAEWEPINKADWLDTLLYLPETIYAVILMAVIADLGLFKWGFA